MTLKLHLTSQNALIKKTTNLSEEVRGKHPLCTAGGNINECRHFGNQYRRPSKLKRELQYDPAKPVLDIQPVESKTEP